MKNNIESKTFISIKNFFVDYISLFDNSMIYLSSFEEIFSSLKNIQQTEFVCQGTDHYLFKHNESYIAIDDELQYFVFLRPDFEGIRYVTGWPSEKINTPEKNLVIDSLYIHNKEVVDREILLLEEDKFHFKRMNDEDEIEEVYSDIKLNSVMDAVENKGIKEELKIIDDITESIKTLKKEK